MPAQNFTISGLAASANVNIETVRYYQRRGLLDEPVRPHGGVRHYQPADIARLQFIRRAQSWGFSLQQIAELLELKGQQACQQTLELTESKLADVRQRLDQLRQLEQELIRLVADCREAVEGNCCPTLNRLSR